jgi:hypothetical protein
LDIKEEAENGKPERCIQYPVTGIEYRTPNTGYRFSHPALSIHVVISPGYQQQALK